MMKNKLGPGRFGGVRKLLALAAMAAAAGCAASVEPSDVYRANVPFSGKGYSEKPVGEGAWEVVYETSMDDRTGELAVRYARYRAAELAYQAGYPYFHVVRMRGWTYSTNRVPTSRIVRLTIHGARSANEPIRCEMDPPSSCTRHATEAFLLQNAPVKRQGAIPARDPAATQPPVPGQR